MKTERAKPTLTNRRNPLWGECDVCGHKDLLTIKGDGEGLILLCSACNDEISSLGISRTSASNMHPIGSSES